MRRGSGYQQCSTRRPCEHGAGGHAVTVTGLSLRSVVVRRQKVDGTTTMAMEHWSSERLSSLRSLQHDRECCASVRHACTFQIMCISLHELPRPPLIAEPCPHLS